MWLRVTLALIAIAAVALFALMFLVPPVSVEVHFPDGAAPASGVAVMALAYGVALAYATCLIVVGVMLARGAVALVRRLSRARKR